MNKHDSRRPWVKLVCRLPMPLKVGVIWLSAIFILYPVMFVVYGVKGIATGASYANDDLERVMDVIKQRRKI